MDDQQIIRELCSRNESALDSLSAKYSRLYTGILRQVLGNEADIAECANDLLLAVWNAIPPNRPLSLPAYLCRLARNIGIDRLRYETRQKRNSGYTVSLSELADCIPGNLPVQAQDIIQIREILSNFVRTLEPETQVLFVRRYIYLEPVASLAQRFAMPENRVAVKLYRARKQLQKTLQKEGISL